MAIIEVRDLVKRFNGLAAVDGVSFDVAEGATTVRTLICCCTAAGSALVLAGSTMSCLQEQARFRHCGLTMSWCRYDLQEPG